MLSRAWPRPTRPSALTQWPSPSGPRCDTAPDGAPQRFWRYRCIAGVEGDDTAHDGVPSLARLLGAALRNAIVNFCRSRHATRGRRKWPGLALMRYPIGRAPTAAGKCTPRNLASVEAGRRAKSHRASSQAPGFLGCSGVRKAQARLHVLEGPGRWRSRRTRRVTNGRSAARAGARPPPRRPS